MRRNEREITDIKEIAEVINAAEYGVMALYDKDYPYSVPLNFAYDGEYLYAHSAHEGKKLDLLRANPNVHITFIAAAKYALRSQNAASCTMLYQCAAVSGKAELLDATSSLEERQHALKIICRRFKVDHLPMPEGAVAKTTVIRIKINSLTGKRNP